MAAKELPAPYDLVRWVAENGKLPVVNFSAGGIATPADAALMMQLGAEGVFVGSGIFKSEDPASRADAIVRAGTNYRDAAVLAEVSRRSGRRHGGHRGGEDALDEKIQYRGWRTEPRERDRLRSRSGAGDAILSPEFGCGEHGPAAGLAHRRAGPAR